jgi:hypothetical protein
LQNWGAENDLLLKIIDPTLLSDSFDLSLKTRVASDGHPPWATGDPIHLTATACWDLATIIGESMLAGAAGDSASEAGSGSHAHKRRRIKLVVTMPPPDNQKRQRGSGHARVAGWLVDCADAGHVAGSSLSGQRRSGRVRVDGCGHNPVRGHLSGRRGHYVGTRPRGGWRPGGGHR